MSKKASRKLNFDDEMDDDFYDQEEDYDYDYNNVNTEPQDVYVPPKRSVTLFDFMSPKLAKMTTSETSKKSTDQTSKNDHSESDSYDQPYDDDYEEDFEEEDNYDDAQELDKMFKKIENQFDIKKCDRNKIISTFRELDYNVKTLTDMVKEGRFGKAVPKRTARFAPGVATTTPKPAKARFAPNSAPQNQPAPVLEMKRSKSLSSIKETLDQHLTTQIQVNDVKSEIAARKKHINLVIVGHVDAGKSTLIGNILLLSGGVSAAEMEKIRNDSKASGHAQDMLAWISAQDETERQRGVTIDVSMNEFETKDRSITVLDAPGHRDFVPNMIAGASQADSAILVVDVSNPNIEKGQAGEHLLLCRSLGVNNLIVCINKMDSFNYEESAFTDVKNTLTRYLKSIGWSAIVFIPTKANNADDLLKPTDNMPWYTGPTVFDAINKLEPPKWDVDSPFLMCVSESVETGSQAITVSGRVESGYICPKDSIRVLPADQIVRVTNVTIDGKPVKFAPAGYICDVTLNTTLAVENIMIGSALSDPKKDIHACTNFVAQVRTFRISRPITLGANLVFHRHAVDSPLKVDKFLRELDKKTKKVKKSNMVFAFKDQLFDAAFSLDTPIAIEPEAISRSFGRFIIRANGETLGFGKVTSITPMKNTLDQIALKK